MARPARSDTYSSGDTSDLLLDCGGTVGFTEWFVYLGSLLHYDLSDHHDVEARLKRAPQAFRKGLRWRRPGGFGVWLSVVVPHGKAGAAAG